MWPICLPTKGDEPLLTTDMEVEVFGFGVREIRGAERSYAEILNQTPLNISDHEYCRSLMTRPYLSLYEYSSSVWDLSGDQICARGSGSDQDIGRVPDTCSGDSGGGLVTKYRVFHNNWPKIMS